MAINRPTGEQIRFVSAKTGDHILDNYMEMVERGNRTLYELLDDIYDPSTGEIHDDFIQLRIESSTQRLQIRIGQYVDPNLGWENTPNYILRHRGAWTPSTAYELLDIVTDSNYSYICITPHTSSSTINTTNFKLLFDADFIENYAIAAANSAATALSHSNTSLSHANSSDSARLLSESARDASQLAQSLSESARNDSQAAQSLSESARDASIAAKSLSESARDKAQKWAEESENVPVEAGLYSAKHWAAKALLYGGDKLTKAGDAMTGLLTLSAGADIPSAPTVNLTTATGNCPKITGTTAITAWTMNTGQQMKCIAGGALPLTYHATTNNIEGGASYTCAAGDIINLVKGLDGVVRVRIEEQGFTYPKTKPQLNLDFANTKGLDSRITFTRASSATYFDADGVMQTASNDVPRFDHNPVTGESLGLLIEEQRTNLLPYSEQINGNWSPSSADCLSIIADQGVAPDGTLTMDKVVTNDTLSNGHIAYRTFAGAASTTYTFSMFFKKAELPLARMQFGNSGFSSTNHGAVFDLDAGSVVFASGTVTATMQHVGNGIYRCSITATSDSDGGVYVCAFGPAPAGIMSLGVYMSPGIGLGVYAWGTQIEADAFPTSYIKTEASQKTRAADSALMTGTDFSSWYNATEGTIYYAATGYSNAADTTVYCIDDGATNQQNQLDARYTSNGTAMRLRSRVSATSLVDMQPSTFALGSKVKSAFGYKLDDFAGSRNGEAVVTDTSGLVPSGMVRFRFAMRGTVTGTIGAWHINRLSYYPRRLSDSELQALTA